ncbi:MAG TPA: class I SAM-dependent methyltransferase [Anaerolineales bacterium]
MTVQIDPEGIEPKYLQQFAEFDRRRVLEVGCGDGRLTWRYARRAGRVAGIDMHRDDLRVALIERPADLATTVHFTSADAVRLPFSAQTFDLAIFAWSF